MSSLSRRRAREFFFRAVRAEHSSSDAGSSVFDSAAAPHGGYLAIRRVQLAPTRATAYLILRPSRIAAI